MPSDTPNPDMDPRERGTFANHGGDPTLAGYLSSAFMLLSVPAFIVIAYGGHWAGYYPEPTVIPVFAGLLVGSILLVFAVMHVLTRTR